jgi:hypothetical protein
MGGGDKLGEEAKRHKDSGPEGRDGKGRIEKGRAEKG